MVKLKGLPFLQNRPPGAVTAINAVYEKAAKAIEKKVHQYRSLGNDRYRVLNKKLGHVYKFTLKLSDCGCIDSITNTYKIPCVHVVFLLIELKLSFSYLSLASRRNIRNAIIKPVQDRWEILGAPS